VFSPMLETPRLELRNMAPEPRTSSSNTSGTPTPAWYWYRLRGVEHTASGKPEKGFPVVSLTYIGGWCRRRDGSGRTRPRPLSRTHMRQRLGALALASRRWCDRPK
jgi:hypothetical protein